MGTRKTSVEIDEELLEAARKILETTTVKDTVEEAFREVARVEARRQEVEARIVKMDPADRRIGLSIKAADLPDEEFDRQKEEILDGLKPGDDMVDLAGAFDLTQWIVIGRNYLIYNVF